VECDVSHHVSSITSRFTYYKYEEDSRLMRLQYLLDNARLL
jgi:hypothetical protein